MHIARKFAVLLVLMALVAALVPALTVSAQTEPYLTLHTFVLTCQSGGTQIQHSVRFDMFLPAGYYRTSTVTGHGTFTDGPFVLDQTRTDLVWNSFTGAAPYNENTIIYNPADVGVYEAGYSANCNGVADGQPANYTYWSHSLGDGSKPSEPASLVPGRDMVMMPAGAVVGTFVAGTPLYYAPEPGAAMSQVMAIGKSLWVYGQDSTHQFYQVLLSGSTYWVPVSTIGPTYDQVWNGTPLPTTDVN